MLGLTWMGLSGQELVPNFPNYPIKCLLCQSELVSDPS